MRVMDVKLFLSAFLKDSTPSKISKQESKAINIARLIFVVGVMFIHFPISYISADGINLKASDTPLYNILSSHFFLSDTCLSGLFFLSGYLFFKNILGGVF